MRRYKGLAYPITKSPQGFFRNGNSDLDEIKSSIAAIVLTEPGERVFESHFGTDLLSVNLNAPKEMAINDFRMRIAATLKRWEKRVQVNEVIVDLQPIKEQLILITTIYFVDPIDIKKTHNLTIYKSLGGIDGRALPF